MSSGTNGKGSARRRTQISEEQFAANWEAVFAKRPPQPIGSPEPRVLIADGEGMDWQMPDLKEILGEEKWSRVQDYVPKPMIPDCGHRGGYLSIHPAKDGRSQCTDCANRMRGFY